MTTPRMKNDAARTPLSPALRNPEWWEVQQLQRQGCSAGDWNNLLLGPKVDLSRIRNVQFRGCVTITSLDPEAPGDPVIEDSAVEDCFLGPDPVISHVGIMKGLRLGSGVTVMRTARLTMEPEAPCGVGTEVAVLDETGSRPVILYPGLSAQMATLMARMPRLTEERLKGLVDQKISCDCYDFDLGDNARVLDCGVLENVRVWPGVTIDGARRLVNGSVINNAPKNANTSLAYIGSGVQATDFIVEDGILDSGAYIERSFIGQGAELSKGFTAHDSLFFANCAMENGEACAVLAGPYSVSMHKSTLLIGCILSFMNAGSATNQSNHMYKLGPVHWGILERGVKTSSNSYLMLGAKIGAFSLLMGDHKTHPDSSEFPFSYLFGDEKGATVVVPAMMLRSCGLLRDEKKWPNRDKRTKGRLPLHDRINFRVLNPHTVSHILKALDTIDKLMARPADDDRFVRYKGMKFSRASLERARMIYGLAIYKYLHTTLGEEPIPPMPEDGAEPERWLDLCGQLIPKSYLQKALKEESIDGMERVFDMAAEEFPKLERDWMGRRFGDFWRERQKRIPLEAERFDEMVEEDRQQYRENLKAENDMLALI